MTVVRVQRTQEMHDFSCAVKQRGDEMRAREYDVLFGSEAGVDGSLLRPKADAAAKRSLAAFGVAALSYQLLAGRLPTLQRDRARNLA